jgi:CRP/FNR family transcriptional regulator, cyclic AMP receptor protein
MSTIQEPGQLYELLGRAGEAIRLSPAEVIFEKGDRGDVMYILRAGSVALGDGERLVDRVDAPGLFGEMALIEREPRALTATAEDDAEVVAISARQFWILVHETPRFAHLVMSVMARRLRRAGATT